MTYENISNTSEVKTGPVDDNARKFILDELGSNFLKDMQATSFLLSVDWLETGDDNETKLARKEYDDGETQILRIKKATNDGRRTSVKPPISAEQYQEELADSVLHIAKRRYEFKYVQQHVIFSLKYDEFMDSALRLLEVDAPTDEERDSFDPTQFAIELTEVSDDPRYTGFRIAEVM